MDKTDFGRTGRYFGAVTARPLPVLLASLALMTATAISLPGLVKDTTADAWIDPQDPALIYRDRVEEIFGLKDPLVVAVLDRTPGGVFNARTLALVRRLSQQVQALDNVDPERVTSLATENHIVGDAEGMIVEPFFEENGDYFRAPAGSQGRAAEIEAAVGDFPLYQGSLVARDGSATLIVAELIDETAAPSTYDAVMTLLDQAPLPPGVEIHVAGEGAVAGSLSAYIDRDAARLNPLAAIVITLILALAFMSVRAAVLPNLVVLGTLAGTLGLMAASGVSFYVITNGLVANLIGIAVADSIHIFSQYYQELRERPQAPKRELVARAMTVMWRPVTLTTLTTMAGFLALAASAQMPPVRYFGLFAAAGVALAWIHSMTLLPAAMTLWPGQRLPWPFRRDHGHPGGDLPSRATSAFGRIVLAHPKAVLGIALLVLLLGAGGASRIVVNDARIENFQTDEPIYRADKAINLVMDGTYYLDVMVETANAEDLHQPENLRRIERLQEFLLSLPHVNGTTSVVDYVKQMHRAVNENRPEAYRVPDDPLLVSQLFLLYSASSSPTDFEEEIDYAHQRALVRARVDTGSYLSNRRIVTATERYLRESFDAPGITGTVTGRLDVDYHWILRIASSNAGSVALSFLGVLVVAALLYRSFAAAALSAIPIGMAVLLVYAVMGYGGIWLGVGTSMFAAIAIGLGVDFAIHTLDRIEELVERHGLSDEALLRFFPSTGRALLFNFLAVALGFGVLLTSDVPPLVRFGTLVAAAISTAFIAALTIIPALVKLVRPAFLVRAAQPGRSRLARAAEVVLALGLAIGALAWSAAPRAEEPPSGRELMEQVNARNEGESVVRDFTLELIDRGGTARVQKTTGYRKYFGKEKRTIFFYTDPANIRGTGFLTYDYPDSDVDDDQWLYLPALRKIRRVSASERGDYFLGTDLTYEEIKKENKLEITDYSYATLGTEVVDGITCHLVEGIPVNREIAAELGYSRILWRVDPAVWMSRRTDYWDTNGNHLKTIHNVEIEQIDGIWTAMKIDVRNHKTGHRTLLTFTRVDYAAPVDGAVFDQSRLRRGL